MIKCIRYYACTKERGRRVISLVIGNKVKDRMVCIGIYSWLMKLIHIFTSPLARVNTKRTECSELDKLYFRNSRAQNKIIERQTL